MLLKNCTELPLGLFVCCYYASRLGVPKPIYNPTCKWITLIFYLEIAGHAAHSWVFPLRGVEWHLAILGLGNFHLISKSWKPL